MRRSLDLGGINWVIIGGRRKVTYPNHIPKYVPPRAWVERIIAEARRVGSAVFLKDNLEWGEVVREWPRG
jgi:protein gp37